MLFDEIIQILGEFGTYQSGIYFVLGLTGFLNGWNNMAITFTGANMDHWCDVPQLSNLTFEFQKRIAIPPDERSRQTYSQCKMYDLDYGSYTQEDFLTWNRSIMVNSSTPTKECTSWVYDQSVFIATLRSKWNLVCDKDALVQLIQSVYMCGFLVGSAAFGQLSDRIGRIKTLISATILQVIFCLIGTFTPILWTYFVCRFFVGCGIAGGFTIYTVLVMEIVGKKFRVITGIMAHMFFTVGMMIISGISWAVRDHVKLELIIALSTFALLIVFSIASESPRWLVGVKQDEKADRVLRRMAAINRAQLPAALHLEENRNNDKITNARQPTVLDLLKSSTIRPVTLNMWLCWFVTCTAFYGLSLGVSFLKGSLFLNNTISALVQIPAYILTAVALEKTGRRIPTMLVYLSMGLFSVLCMPLVGREEYNWLFTTFLMLGKAFGAGSFALVYVYAAEVFPTVVRNVGVGSSSTVARVGGLLQPFITLTENAWQPLPFLIYGALSLIVGITAFFLPETRGRKLPETLEDMEILKRQKTPMELDRREDLPKENGGKDNSAYICNSSTEIESSYL